MYWNNYFLVKLEKMISAGLWTIYASSTPQCLSISSQHIAVINGYANILWSLHSEHPWQKLCLRVIVERLFLPSSIKPQAVWLGTQKLKQGHESLGRLGIIFWSLNFLCKILNLIIESLALWGMNFALLLWRLIFDFFFKSAKEDDLSALLVF